MADLSDIVPVPTPGLTAQSARVISISGRTVTVDLGGPVTIPTLDSCYPVPDQYVWIIGTGTAMIAVGAMGGPYRQATMTVTATNTTTATGIVNGVSGSHAKFGAFTPSIGDVLPLIWSADGNIAWVGPLPGVAYVPPPPSGGGSGGSPSGGGSGGVTTGTATYAATQAGSFSALSGFQSGRVNFNADGTYFYGTSRFKELQGRTITGFRVNLAGVVPYAVGAGSVFGHGAASHGSVSPSHGFSGGSISGTGWRPLSLSLAAYLIAGTGTGGLMFTGSGSDAGTPYGTLQFDWRR